MSDAEIENEIQAKGLNAPRLTPAMIRSVIVNTTFTIMPSGKATVCELTLKNGYTVRGESAVVSVANFDKELGEKIAREKAIGKIWELEGYLLQQRLHEARLREIGGEAAEERPERNADPELAALGRDNTPHPGDTRR